ncbi:MAG: hypothetical protein WDW36_001428 [Sanguina aurantia]
MLACSNHASGDRLPSSNSPDYIINKAGAGIESTSDATFFTDFAGAGTGVPSRGATAAVRPPFSALPAASSSGQQLEPQSWREVGVIAAEVVDPSGALDSLMSHERAALQRRFAEAFESVEGQFALTHIPGVQALGSGLELFCAALCQQQDSASSPAQALLALHRAARALLDAASWLALPGARTGSLAVRVALHAGPLSSSPSQAGAATKLRYEGEVLAGVSTLLQWAPPMTVVCGDLVAYQLRELGLGSVRELPPILLQPGVQRLDRRVWLAEPRAAQCSTDELTADQLPPAATRRQHPLLSLGTPADRLAGGMLSNDQYLAQQQSGNVARSTTPTGGLPQLQQQQQPGVSSNRRSHLVSSLFGGALDSPTLPEQRQQQQQQAPFLLNNNNNNNSNPLPSPADSIPFIQYGADIMGDDKLVRNWVHQHSAMQTASLRHNNNNNAAAAAAAVGNNTHNSAAYSGAAVQQAQQQYLQQRAGSIASGPPGLQAGGLPPSYMPPHQQMSQQQLQQPYLQQQQLSQQYQQPSFQTQGSMSSQQRPMPSVSPVGGASGGGGHGNAEMELLALRSEMGAMRQQIEGMNAVRAAAAAAETPTPMGSSYGGSVMGDAPAAATKKKGVFSQLFSRKPSRKKSI